VVKFQGGGFADARGSARNYDGRVFMTIHTWHFCTKEIFSQDQGPMNH
jgi:hypothetical protein